MKIETGDLVVLVLHSPREKFWGVLQDANQAGVFVRGIDLDAFEDFLRAFQADEHFYGFASIFFPMWRVERMTRDERDGDIPSLLEQFEQRTGVKITDV